MATAAGGTPQPTSAPAPGPAAATADESGAHAAVPAMASPEGKDTSMPDANSGISAAEPAGAQPASMAIPTLPRRDVSPVSTLERRGFRRKGRVPLGASCPPAPWPARVTASMSDGAADPSTSLPGRRFRGWTKSALLAGESAAAGDGCCFRLPCVPAGIINEAIGGAGAWRAVRHLSHGVRRLLRMSTSSCSPSRLTRRIY
jgi:hypothetical protein